MKAGWTLVLAAALTGQGCATIFAGGQPYLDVDVSDAPPGTAATLRGVSNDIEVRDLGLPVRRFALDRGSNYALGVSAPGHKPELVIIKQQFSPFAIAELGAMLVGIASLAVGLSSSQGVFTTVGAALVAGGEVGFIVDEVTLNVLSFDKRHVVIKLEPR